MSTARKKTDSKRRQSPKPPKKSDIRKAAKQPKKSVGKAKQLTPKKKVVTSKSQPSSKKAKQTQATLAKSRVNIPKTNLKKPAVAKKKGLSTKEALKKIKTKSKLPLASIKTKSAPLKSKPAQFKPTKIHPPAKVVEKKVSDKSSLKPAQPVKAPKLNALKSEPPTKPKKKIPVPPPSNTKPEIVAKIRIAQAEKELRKDLAQPTPKPALVPTTPIPMIEKGKDRLILMVRDPYWLHAHWDITRHAVERARVSIAEHWHTAHPILRMIKIDDTATTSNAETIFRDIEIHGGVRNWYVEIDKPGGSYRILMGYITSNGRFYELARSNSVTMPMPGSKEASDDHWADIAKNAEKVFAMSGGYNEETNSGDLKEVFEERLKRTMDTDVLSQFGSGAEGGLKRNKQFHFNVDAELIVFGTTAADAHVNVGGEPVKVRNDGSFSIRLQFPDKRQVLRVSAKSRDGVEEQTVVIAVERNTKVMEPLSLDADDL